MTGIEEHPNPDEFESRLIDHVLGEGDAEQRAAMHAEIETDLEVAVQVGELRTLFDDFRSLTVTPSGNVPLALRYALDRRARLRAGVGVSGRAVHVASSRRVALADRLWSYALCGGIAAAVLVGFLLLDRSTRPHLPSAAANYVSAAPTPNSLRRPAEDRQLAQFLSTSHLPITDPAFVACVQRYDALPLPESFAGWISARDRLHTLREQSRLRFEPEARRRLMHSIGAPDLDQRSTTLAAAIAGKVERELAEGVVVVADLSLALRALLAAGSTRTEGPHRAAVGAVADVLIDRLARLDDGDAASALAALADLAVLEGGRIDEIVGVHVDSLARATLTPREDGSRPGLLHWRTRPQQLADAGRVLQVAAAFGVHAGVAFRARMMIAAHIDERLLARQNVEDPTLIAAQIYGFGDLIDLDEAERSLRLWDTEMLVPQFVTLHHLAWSKFPTRPGWAAFQRELRGLSSVPTPQRTGDAAALLLCLTMNFAAPGVLTAVGLSG